MRAPRVWTEDRIAEACRLWNEGLSAAKIAAQLGVTLGSFLGTTSHQREKFPVRMKAKPQIQVRETEAVEVVAPVETLAPAPRRTNIAGQWIEHVKKTTRNGAVITMPRVSFIDGARDSG